MNKKKNPHFRIRLEWNPGDIFMGVYVRGPRLNLDLEPGSNNYYWNVWICLIPCLPIHIRWMPCFPVILGMDLATTGPDFTGNHFVGEMVCSRCGEEVVFQPVVDSTTSQTVCKHGYPYKECLHHRNGTRANVNCVALIGPNG